MENHTREVAGKLHSVRETNGIYPEGLAHALHEAEIWVSVINPVHMRANVKNMGNGLPGQAAGVVTLIP